MLFTYNPMIIKNIKTPLALLQNLKKYISIELANTPNPNSIKFIPIGHRVLGDEGTLDIPSKQYATVSPLAQQLFKINGVTRIFYASDYLSVAKEQQADWSNLKPQIIKVIQSHFDQKIPLLTEEVSVETNDIDPTDLEVVQFIKQIIATRIRPNVQEDGGDVKFQSFDEATGTLKIKMVGACAGCPSSTATLKGGIQRMLTYYVKEIKQVISSDSC